MMSSTQQKNTKQNLKKPRSHDFSAEGDKMVGNEHKRRQNSLASEESRYDEARITFGGGGGVMVGRLLPSPAFEAKRWPLLFMGFVVVVFLVSCLLLPLMPTKAAPFSQHLLLFRFCILFFSLFLYLHTHHRLRRWSGKLSYHEF